MDVFSRRLAEAFGRVFVLPGIFRGLLKIREPTARASRWGLGACLRVKFRNLEARNAIFSIVHVNISNSMECKIPGIFSHISDVLLTI